MSPGNIIFLISIIIAIAAVAWYFLVRRPLLKQREAEAANTAQATAPRDVSSTGAVPHRTPVERYEPAPRVIVDNRPVYVQQYPNQYPQNNDLLNLIVAEEIIQEIREERREERYEEMRQERYEEPARYEEPEQHHAEPASYDAPDTSYDSGSFGSGDDGSF